MDFFNYRDGELYCEDVPVTEIARSAGTPFYLYSYGTLERHFTVFDRAFAGVSHLVCYSCKANSSLAIIRSISRLGGGADIVSGGELHKALTAGIQPKKIVFSGVGKKDDELTYAIKSNILMINAESEQEVDAISRIGKRMKRTVPLSIRVNPQIDAKTHPYITTGMKKNKFGVLWDDAMRLYMKARQDPFLEPVGISSHIGSQILEVGPFREAVHSLKSMAEGLRTESIDITYLDIGGGLGITYKDELPPHPDEYASVVARELAGTNLTVILEPGRVLVGNSGVFVTRLLYVKQSPEKTFYIVDGAMNDLVRPSLYNAYHEILSVRSGRERQVTVDVVGPICESGDFLAKDREMPVMNQGDLLAIKGAGAYGFSMSSNYNARRRVAEVLVKGEHFFVVRKRETYRDLTRGETIPDFLEG